MRFIDAIATFVTHRRAAALVAVLLVTVGTGIWIPSLHPDPRPSQLTASSIEDQAEVASTFRAHFGSADHVVVLLIEAPDVTAPPALSYIHRLAYTGRSLAYVERVEGITVSALAVPVDPNDEESGATLEQIEGEGEGLDDLDDDEELVDPELEDALGVLVQSAPERFPYGLGTVAERLGSLRYGPAVEGERVTSAERRALMAALEDAPLVTGRLISADHTVTAIALYLDERVEEHLEMQRAVGEIDGWLADNPAPPGVRVSTAGLPHLFNAMIVKMEHDNFRIVPLTLVVCLLLLFISFRWLPGTFLPVLAVCITAVMVLGSMAFIGETMNVLNNIVPPLLIIIGVSDSIHLVGRYREELARTPDDKLAAARRTVTSMAVACFLTSITTAVGLASLLVSQTEMLRRFGVIAGLGVMIAYFVTILFLPSAMTWFRPPPIRRRSQQVSAGLLERGIFGLTTRIIRRPGRYIVSACILFVTFVTVAFFVDVDSALLDEFEETDEVYTSTSLMERQLEGVRPLEVMLSASEAGRMHDPAVLQQIGEIEAWLAQDEAVLSVLSPTDYLLETWERLSGGDRSQPFHSREQVEALVLLFEQADPNPLYHVVSEDGRVARIRIRLSDVGARRSLVLIEQLSSRLDTAFGSQGIDVAMTGEGYTGSVGLNAVVTDLLGSLGMALLLIFGMLVVLFRSFRLGALSIPPNLIPLVGTMAWMSARDIPLNAATVIVFSISLGLAVDGSIHLLARYREEIGRGLTRNVALLRAARGTGRAVVISCVTLMLGFGVMLLSSFLPVRRFGELIAVTVGSCLLSTLIVQPALLRVAAPRWVRQKRPRGPAPCERALKAPELESEE